MIPAAQLQNAYAGRRVLVTGGLGFIGSNLVHVLHALGAEVTVMDSLDPGCGGDPRNLEPIAEKVRLVLADIGCAESAASCLRDVDVVFNLASEIAHTPRIDQAGRDLALNVSAQLSFLGHCVHHAPGVRVVYTSTRQVYGAPASLPVDEGHPFHPVDFNGVHKLAASQYHLLLWRLQKLDSVVLYLTNIYGPRMALHLPQQGFLANFLAKALRGERLEVFGDGLQLRDPVYVDDAVRAILHAGAIPLGANRSFNIGHPQTHSVLEIARRLSHKAGLEEPLIRPFPAALQPIDVGSYATDTRHAEAVLGWVARVSIAEGLGSALESFGWKAPTASSTRGGKREPAGQERIA